MKYIILGLLLSVAPTSIMNSAENQNNALHEAVRENNIAQAERLILAGYDVDALDTYGLVPLFKARSLGMVKLLLSHGADPNGLGRQLRLSDAMVFHDYQLNPPLLGMLRTLLGLSKGKEAYEDCFEGAKLLRASGARAWVDGEKVRLLGAIDSRIERDEHEAELERKARRTAVALLSVYQRDRIMTGPGGRDCLGLVIDATTQAITGKEGMVKKWRREHAERQQGLR